MQVLSCRFKADLSMPAWFYACHVEKRAINDSFTEMILTLGAPMTIENVLASTVRRWRRYY